jgi:hypothetical protein
VPLVTAGTQLWTQTVTPASTASKFIISQTFNLDSGTANRSITAAVFRGSTCVAATSINIATSGRAQALAVMAVDAPATVAATVYSLRMGVSTAATWYLNQGAVGAVTYGGTVNHSDWTITEI